MSTCRESVWILIIAASPVSAVIAELRSRCCYKGKEKVGKLPLLDLREITDALFHISL